MQCDGGLLQEQHTVPGGVRRRGLSVRDDRRGRARCYETKAAKSGIVVWPFACRMSTDLNTMPTTGVHGRDREHRGQLDTRTKVQKDVRAATHARGPSGRLGFLEEAGDAALSLLCRRFALCAA
jgi:hypothetical protein